MKRLPIEQAVKKIVQILKASDLSAFMIVADPEKFTLHQLYGSFMAPVSEQFPSCLDPALFEDHLTAAQREEMAASIKRVSQLAGRLDHFRETANYLQRLAEKIEERQRKRGRGCHELSFSFQDWLTSRRRRLTGKRTGAVIPEERATVRTLYTDPAPDIAFADLHVAVIDRLFLENQSLRTELLLAIEEKKSIILLVHEGITLPMDITAMLEECRDVTVRSWRDEAECRRLITHMETHGALPEEGRSHE